MILVPLDRIDVPNPCTVPWAEMRGTGRVRHCGHCRQSVYDLSAMTRVEAEDLILATEGRLCVRYFRRADGTVKTAPCGRAARFAGRTVAAAVGILSGLLAVSVGGCLIVGENQAGLPWYRDLPVLSTVAEWILGPPQLGKPCFPRPATPNPTPPAEVAPEPHAR